MKVLVIKHLLKTFFFGHFPVFLNVAMGSEQGNDLATVEEMEDYRAPNHQNLKVRGVEMVIA